MPRILLTALVLMSGTTVAETPSGERLAYLVGCVNCHHQTPMALLHILDRNVDLVIKKKNAAC